MISRENQLIDMTGLNRFRIGDEVIADACADHDRFEGVVIGIELQRVYASRVLQPSITLLHDGDQITDGFSPDDLRKVSAALSASPAQPVAVKPLEWSTQNSHGWTVHVAKGLGCTYEASAKVWNDGWIWGLAEDDSNFDAEDEEAAKAAAQQDYETRIRSALVPPAVPGEVEKPVICIGRSTISRLMAGEEVEIDAAIMIPASDLNEPASVEGSPLLEWAVEQWKRQVSGRPLQNVHRRSLDDVWRQVIRWAGGDPIVLLGPAHDELRAAEGPWS